MPRQEPSYSRFARASRNASMASTFVGFNQAPCSLPAGREALVGLSQGTMPGLYVALRRQGRLVGRGRLFGCPRRRRSVAKRVGVKPPFCWCMACSTKSCHSLRRHRRNGACAKPIFKSPPSPAQTLTTALTMPDRAEGWHSCAVSAILRLRLRRECRMCGLTGPANCWDGAIYQSATDRHD